MEKLIEQFQKTPLPQKVGVLIFLLVGMSAGNYFGLISPLEDSIVSLTKKQADLDADYTQKKTIANNLNSYRARMEKLQQDLDLALTELPQEAQIDELLRQLNDVGKKAGLGITAVKPGPESAGPQNFIAKIPIAMAVDGSYEEIAVFFESVSKLRRIVNINDISLTAPVKKNEKVELKATFAATTFRFKQPPPPKAGKPGAKKK